MSRFRWTYRRLAISSVRRRKRSVSQSVRTMFCVVFFVTPKRASRMCECARRCIFISIEQVLYEDTREFWLNRTSPNLSHSVILLI